MNNWDELPYFLTVTEAAKLTRVGRAQMYELVRHPSFPSVRFGKVIRIPRDAFREWLYGQMAIDHLVASVNSET
jgi:excisionase family DNA binding protein